MLFGFKICEIIWNKYVIMWGKACMICSLQFDYVVCIMLLNNQVRAVQKWINLWLRPKQILQQIKDDDHYDYDLSNNLFFPMTNFLLNLKVFFCHIVDNV